MTIKIIIIALFICSLFLISCTITANQSSKKNQAPGLHEGQLLRCPDKPNCINTEYPDNSSHYFPPIDFSAAAKDQIMPLAIAIIQKMGGTVVIKRSVIKRSVTKRSVTKESTQESSNENNHYLAATFTSSLFRFIDDFELRQDNISHKLHIRSASRTGYSDFEVNKRRVIQFSEYFKRKLPAPDAANTENAQGLLLIGLAGPVTAGYDCAGCGKSIFYDRKTPTKKSLSES